jgi:hypothetical protein
MVVYPYCQRCSIRRSEFAPILGRGAIDMMLAVGCLLPAGERFVENARRGEGAGPMTGEISPSEPGVALEPGRGLAERPSVDLGRLAADLRSLGLLRGQDLLVHCSLSAIGWVDGGPATLLQAIRDTAGSGATIVVPAQTPWTSRTSEAFRAATARS